MSLLSNFIPFASGGGINSIQTGYVSASTTGGSAGEDRYYYDVTITSVTTSKAVPDFFGSVNYAPYGAVSAYSDTVAFYYICFPRLTSATNLRLSSNSGSGTLIAGRWYVIEAK